MSENAANASANGSSGGGSGSGRREYDRSRKDAHRKEILNRTRQEKLREELQKKWRRDKEFLSTLKFRNELPDPPAGPHCVKMALPTPLEKYGEYFKSSLEQKYTWKMHWENDLGLNLSFVDPKQWQGPVVPPKMEPADEQLVLWDGRGSAKAKAGKTPDLPRASWLNRTTYMTHDLTDNVHNFQTKSIEEIRLQEEEQAAQLTRGPFDVEAIEMSFAAASAKKAVPERPDAHVEWIIPIMPDEVLWANRYSVVNFHTDPALVDEDTSKKRRQDGSTGEEDVAGDDSELSRKRSKVLKSIITNDRLDEDERYLISLIEPKDDTTMAKQEGEYSWLRDYSLEQRDPRETFYVLMIDPEPEPEIEGEHSQLKEEMGCPVNRSERLCTYVPVNSNMRLQRLPFLKSEPHSATVRRRFMDPWERKDRAENLAEVWPVVLPDMFNDLPEVRPTDVVEMEEPLSATATTAPESVAQTGDSNEEQSGDDEGSSKDRSAPAAMTGFDDIADEEED